MSKIYDIRNRTPAIKDRILFGIHSENASEVTGEKLAGIGCLNLGNSKIGKLKKGDFDGLTGLESLNLNDNGLEELPEGIFEGLENLSELFLNWNQLKGLPDGVFDGLKSLKFLSFDNNNFEVYPALALKNLPSNVEIFPKKEALKKNYNIGIGD